MAKKFTTNNQINSSQKLNTPNINSQISSNVKTVNPVSPAKSSSSAPTKNIVSLTHEQIAERAKSIWMKRGCPNGQDEKNWQEAEKQLKQELGIH
jgi:hypothetical protein